MSVLVVRVSEAEVDFCSDWLFELGATAIEERADNEGVSLITGFVSEGAALGARNLLTERWPCRLEDTGDESDWRDAWLAHLEPVHVAGFTICAPWHDIDQSTDRAARLEIDPGRAFGSGHHPTTRLCLEALREFVEPRDAVLDVGCGTGILTIASVRLGASHVTGVDLNHDVLTVADTNVAANGVEGQVMLREAAAFNSAPTRRRFDLAVANIVIGDLRPLLPAVVRLATRAVVISGFLEPQLDGLLDGIGAVVVDQRQRDGWGMAVLAPVS